MQLPDQAQLLSIAPPELTDVDRELMGDIIVLHTRMRLAKSSDEKDGIRQQIIEKQKLLSYHSPDVTGSAPTTG